MKEDRHERYFSCKSIYMKYPEEAGPRKQSGVVVASDREEGGCRVSANEDGDSWQMIKMFCNW